MLLKTKTVNLKELKEKINSFYQTFRSCIAVKLIVEKTDMSTAVRFAFRLNVVIIVVVVVVGAIIRRLLLALVYFFLKLDID